MLAAEERDPVQEKMQKAFALVSPVDDWRAPINTSASKDMWDRLCALQGVTFEDVLESIRFMTATDPQVTTVVLPGKASAIVVTAKGYRAGPAGP